MDTYCFKKVKSSSILILIERDDGQTTGRYPVTV